MKILHLSNTPLSNSPSNLAKIQKDYGYETRVLLHRRSNMNRVFVGGEVWTGLSEGELEQEIRSSDIIHFHNFAWEQEIFKRYPHLVPIAKKKPKLIQYHSPRTSTENFEVTLKDPSFVGRRAVVAQYHVRQYPEVEYIVPNVLPIFDAKYLPLKTRPNTPHISFAPSNIHLRGWNYKGYDKVKVIAREFIRGGVEFDIIMNTPYEETLTRKKWSTIGMEEVVTGSYHLSFLEYMSFGCATICNMDEKTKDAMACVTGKEAVEELPSFNINLESLPSTLRTLCLDSDLRLERGLAARAWMEHHWNPDKFVRYFNGIYAEL